jgi:hypothetical protein
MQTILSKSRDILTKFKEIRNNYDIPFDYTKTLRIVPKGCIYCKLGKRDNYQPSDIELTCSAWCQFCVETHIKIPDATGLEPQLCGEALEIMINLNYYILTTASTNDTKDNMFLDFYATHEEAKRLADYIETLDHNYGYNLFDNRTKKEVKYNIKNKDFEVYNEDYFGNFGTELNNFIEKELTFMSVWDSLNSRRTLYGVLNEYLKNVH